MPVIFLTMRIVMKKIAFTLFISMLLGLPVNAGTKEFMETCLNSWLGYTIDDVIAVWGYPSDERTIAGKHLLYWTYSSDIYIPQSSYSNVNKSYNSANVYTSTYGGYTITEVCNATLEVDDNNKIIKWEWSGDGCPGSYMTGRKYVNPNNDKWAMEKKLKQQMKAEKKRLNAELKQKKKLNNQKIEDNI